MEQDVHEEIEAALRLAERKPKFIEALLAEQAVIHEKLVALGYTAPKKTRKPRTPAVEGAEPKTRRKKL